MLPWFGASSSLTEFWDNTVYSLSCSLGGPGGVVDGDPTSCKSDFATPQVWAFAFVLGYSVSYIGSAQLNRESATFNMLCAVVTTMTTSLYFLIPGERCGAVVAPTTPPPCGPPLYTHTYTYTHIPPSPTAGTNPNAESTPLWSVLVSLLLSLSGLVLWKFWESRTPAEEQYSLVATGGYHEGVFDKLLVDDHDPPEAPYTWDAQNLSRDDEYDDDDRQASVFKYAKR